MGKSKGSAFEREVSVMLSKWVSSNTQEDVFWRAAMSGGRSTVAFKKGKKLANQVGDISCIHPIGQKFIDAFAVECKAYSNLDYPGLITGKGKLLAFWAEINEQASRYGKEPFMVAKQNRMPAVVCLNREGSNKLGIYETHTLLISRPFDLYIFGAGYFCSTCLPYT